jgi:hypothetical protein
MPAESTTVDLAAFQRGAFQRGVEQVIEESRHLGNGVGFGAVAAHGRLRGSARRLELRYTAVGIWSDGLVEWGANYTDVEEARATAERLVEERG